MTATHQEWFDGDIDDVKIYNKALSLNTILALYNAPASCINCTITAIPAIVGNQSFCSGSFANHSLASISGVTYTWSVTGALISSGNLATVNWSGMGIFTLSASPSNTCVGISNLTVTVGCCTLTPVHPDFTINTDTCSKHPFSLINISTNTTTSCTYSWTFSPDGIPGQSTLPNPSFIYYSTPGQKIIKLKVSGPGCGQIDSISKTLFFLPIPSVSAGPDIYVCTTLGQSIGSLPVAEYSYVWHPGQYVADSTASSTTITKFYNGKLTLVASYSESKCVGYDTMNVYQYPTVTSDKTAICNGDIVTISTSFYGTSNLYSWTPTSLIYQNNSNSIVVKPTTDTTFYLTINSVGGCNIASSQIHVEQPYTLTATYSPLKYCAEDTVTVSVVNPRPQFQYVWRKFADSVTIANGISAKFVYTKSAFAQVSESSVCKNTLLVPIQVLDSSFTNIVTPKIETLCVQPVMTITSSLPKNKYLWSTGDTSATSRALSSGTYWVKTFNYCVYRIDTIRVKINTVSDHFPNIFTPNGDSKNDTLIFEGCAFHTGDVAIEIFDRWGGKVYATSAYQQDWTASGLSDGMYYYILKTNGNNELAKGWLQIIH